VRTSSKLRQKRASAETRSSSSSAQHTSSAQVCASQEASSSSSASSISSSSAARLACRRTFSNCCCRRRCCFTMIRCANLEKTANRAFRDARRSSTARHVVGRLAVSTATTAISTSSTATTATRVFTALALARCAWQIRPRIVVQRAERVACADMGLLLKGPVLTPSHQATKPPCTVLTHPGEPTSARRCGSPFRRCSLRCWASWWCA